MLQAATKNKFIITIFFLKNDSFGMFIIMFCEVQVFIRQYLLIKSIIEIGILIFPICEINSLCIRNCNEEI